jgi:hypothetical protein
MWLMQLAMLFVAMLFLIGPLVMIVRSFELREFSVVVVGLIVPVLFVLLSYAIVLQVLNQLALHSLAHNRRGVASALTHAWRLIRTSPWCAARATVVDLVLFLSVAALHSSLAHFFRVTGLAGPLEWLVLLAVAGFAGVTRAAFWARAYRALGGLSAADQIPGLS